MSVSHDSTPPLGTSVKFTTPNVENEGNQRNRCCCFFLFFDLRPFYDLSPLFPFYFQGRAQQREDLFVQAVRKDFQEEFDSVDALADSLGHPAVSLSVLRKAVPPKVRHEETHVHPHRLVQRCGMLGVRYRPPAMRSFVRLLEVATQSRPSRE